MALEVIDDINPQGKPDVWCCAGCNDFGDNGDCAQLTKDSAGSRFRSLGSWTRIEVVARESERYEIRPFPKIRRAYVDVLREGHRRHIIHGLVEVDITKARSLMQQLADEDTPISFTGFIVACVGKAVDENRMLHAHRWGRRKLVLFDDVDVNLQLEQIEDDGTRIVQSRIVRASNKRTVKEISGEVRAAQGLGEADRRRLRGTIWFVSLPGFIRHLIWRAVMTRPWWTKRFGGTVAVSSVGMFGTSLGWGIPITPAPLMVTVGGIGPRTVLIEDQVENREHPLWPVRLTYPSGGPPNPNAASLSPVSHVIDGSRSVYKGFPVDLSKQYALHALDS